MKTIRTRIAAILLVAAMGITMSACSNDEDSVTPATEGAAVTNNDDSGAEDNESNEAVNNDDNNTAEEETDDLESTLKHEIVFAPTMDGDNTTGNIQDATEPAVTETVVVTKEVVVTEAGGEVATDAKGSTVTEVVTEVQPVTQPYTPSILSDYIYWLDMTKGSDGKYDKVFNGEIYVFEFKVKENTPSGNYAITLSDPDFVNWDEEQLDVKTVDGYVTVGSVQPTASSQVQPGQFTIAASSTKANAGDTIKVTLSASDNPGLVGLLFKVAFDTNALELIDSYPGEALS